MVRASSNPWMPAAVCWSCVRIGPKASALWTDGRLPAAVAIYFVFRHGDRRREVAGRVWGGAAAVPIDARRRRLKRTLQLVAALALALAMARPAVRGVDAPVAKAGDIVIQQGTNHAWVNRSNAFCKIAFILIDAHDPLAKG